MTGYTTELHSLCIMSRTQRTLGLARSLFIYHAIPGRQSRLRKIYRQFVSAGDLVFDLGAHVGNRTRAFNALGCRVIAVEPHPDCVRILTTLFGHSPRIDILPSAVSETVGHVALSISERHPTLNTIDPDWQDDREQDPRFGAIQWNHTLDVPSTTLDALVDSYGLPAFVKIDVEGAEPRILNGLSHRLPALSFEYLPGSIENALTCINRLSTLGQYRFNWSPGESYQLASTQWLDRPTFESVLTTTSGQVESGDIYAILDKT